MDPLSLCLSVAPSRHRPGCTAPGLLGPLPPETQTGSSPAPAAGGAQTRPASVRGSEAAPGGAVGSVTAKAADREPGAKRQRGGALNSRNHAGPLFSRQPPHCKGPGTNPAHLPRGPRGDPPTGSQKSQLNTGPVCHLPCVPKPRLLTPCLAPSPLPHT